MLDLTSRVRGGHEILKIWAVTIFNNSTVLINTFFFTIAFKKISALQRCSDIWQKIRYFLSIGTF